MVLKHLSVLLLYLSKVLNGDLLHWQVLGYLVSVEKRIIDVGINM